jgi:hypothetical protein
VDGSGSSNNLWFARAQDADGAAWNAPVLVTNPAGSNTSLAVVDGMPAIAHSSNSFGWLKFTRATAADGSAWGTPIDIEFVGVSGRASLAVIAGQPAIAYSFVNGINYIRATNVDGSLWGTPLTVDPDGGQPFLLTVAGAPAICYSTLAGGLKYSRASDAVGDNWLSTVTVDPVQSGTTAMALVGGFPAIAYSVQGDADLRYAVAIDANGGAWNPGEILDSTGDVGTNPSLADLGGKAGVSYMDTTQPELMFMRQD